MSSYRIAKLSEVAEVGAGNSAPQKKELFHEGTHPFVRTSDVGQIRFGTISTAADLLNDKGIKGLRLVPKGTILMPKSGASTFLNHRVETSVDCYVSSHLATVTAKPDKAIPRYLLYFLSTVQAQDLIQDHKYPSLTLGVIGSIEVNLPPLEEQKRIVAVLDQAFAALDRARAFAEANVVDAEELFDGWLTAVFHDHPAEWATRKLRDLCHQITVGHVGPMADRYSSAGTPFLRSQNVRPFRIDLGDVKFIDDAFRSELKKSELRPGDVAIVRTGYPGTAAVIPDDLPLANCADLVIARPKDELHPEFLAMFLNSSFGKKMVAEKSVGAAQKHFNVGAAKEVDFAYPGLEDQLTIVNQMKTMRGYSARLYDQCQAKIDELQELRQAVLRQAFAGELT